VVAIGYDLEIQKGQQVFPENKGAVFGREVNSDMPKRRFHALMVPAIAPTKRLCDGRNGS
jgi:hypothetical protein